MSSLNSIRRLGSILLLSTGILAVNGQDAMAPAAPIRSPKETALDAASVSHLELVRRQEALLKSRQLINDGNAYLNAADYEKALSLFEEGAKILSAAPSSIMEVQQINRGKSIAHHELARVSWEKKDFAVSSSHALQAYQADPENREALGLYEKAAASLEKGEGGKAAALPPELSDEKFVKKQKTVLELYRAYENYFKSEQFDEAEAALKDVLRIDPYSATAYHRLREVQMAKYRKLGEGQQQTEMEGLLEVRRSWILPLRRDKPMLLPDQPKGNVEDEGSKASIMRKLNGIIIKNIEFQDTPIMSAIDHLINESREADPNPDKTGVNIIANFAKEGGGDMAPPPPPPVEGGAPADGSAPPADAGAPAPSGNSRPITLKMRNQSLLTVIKFMTQVAQLKYRIEPEAVILVSGDSIQIGKTQTRTFRVSPGVFRVELNRVTSAAGGGGGGGFQKFETGVTSVKADVKKVFEDYGVTFPAGTGVQYNETLGILVATHTNDVLDQMEGIITTINKIPPQVTIEAKFLDVRQTDLDELGFRWAFAPRNSKFVVESGQGSLLQSGAGHISTGYDGNGNQLQNVRNASNITGSALDALLTGGTSALINAGVNTLFSITSTLSNPQFQVMIDALARKQAVNFLAAPRVTVLSGDNAKILVTREFIYPSSYTDPQVQVSAGAAGTGVGITAPSPSSFTTREVGVILDVKPQVNADNTTINVSLAPEVVDFEGFINYNTSAIANNSQFTFTIPQPLFNKRTISTNVIIWDGQVITMGGLIREETTKVDDKIPFLGDLPFVGRLFRSKIDNTIKRNLIIFVRAQIVDPSGKPLRNTDDATFQGVEPIAPATP